MERGCRSPNEWRDTHYRVEGPAAAEFRAAFAEHWIEATGELLLGGPLLPGGFSPVGDHDGPGRHRLNPQRNVSHLMLMTALASAQKERPDCHTLFRDHALTRQQLLEATAHGVESRFIVPGSQTDARIA